MSAPLSGSSPHSRPTPRPALQPASSNAASAQADDVLRDYTGAEFLFISPTSALITSALVDGLVIDAGAECRSAASSGPAEQCGCAASSGPAEQCAANGEPLRANDIARAVRHLFGRAADRGIVQPVLVGAVPFDIDAPPRLGIAQHCRHSARAHAGSASSPAPSSSGSVAAPSALMAVASTAATAGAHIAATPGTKTASVAEAATASVARVARQSPQPATAVYEAAVREALACFERGELSKVVLARTLDPELDASLDLPALMARLAAKNTRGYTYAVPLAGAQEVFLGATPELLVRRLGSRVVLNPLAGSAARRVDAEEDHAVGQALLRSTKDLQEHAIVIDEIAKVLRPLCRTLNVPAHPELVATDALWHLSTLIEGELLDPDMTSLDLAFALHPTPAVCGYPRRAAFEAIMDLEPFDRGFFAGFVGWMDASGDGEWAVSLRCAQCGPGHATLSAGAGIVPGSVPERETAETQTKFRTMLSALGLGHSIEQG